MMVWVLLLLACASGPEEQANPEAREMAISLAERTSPFQREILADGVVTEAEYERAMLTSRECVEQKGWRVGELDAGLNGFTLQFDMIWQTRDDPAEDARLSDEATKAFDDCMNHFHFDVEQVFIQQHVPTGAEQQAQVAEAIACLARAGLAGVDEDSTDVEVSQAILSSSLDEAHKFEAEKCLYRYSQALAQNADD
ncbi:MAG: hypothetical protein ACRDVM_00600 [Acidimicrobiia bacterium]